uniref:Uncharacterized protein n=1 Tax=Avena sativa TaxID=4498 RepID=A0ACD5TH78_AVESA
MSSRRPAGYRAAGAVAGGVGRKKVASGAGSMSLRALREELARQKEEEEERKAREEEMEAQAEKARREEEEKKPTEEEEKQREEERRRRRRAERKKEENQRLEAARRRLGATIVAEGGAAAGDGGRKRPVYASRRSKLQSKPHENVQSSELRIEEEKCNVPHEEDITVDNVLVLREGPSTESSDDDAWENKSLDRFDVITEGNSCLYEGEEIEENHVSSSAPVVNSDNMAQEIVEDIFLSQDAASSNGSGDERELRAPICCILGHVDAGKTKLLDCIRGTRVQEGEAGGITQHIGATYLPVENIRERTSLKSEVTIKVPGLLVIDTPGHESFSKMRSRGVSLCDIALVVVDITRGLEKQTIESLHLLKRHNVRFIVALNKVDRLYGWKSCPNTPILEALKNQSDDVRSEYKWRLTEVITQFKENGFNTAPYYKNKKMKRVFNIVPTSAKSDSGEGVPDLLMLLVRWVPEIMIDKLAFNNSVECTILEVSGDKDLGTTINVVLINGALHQGDQVIVCTKQGPVTTIIRDLLTPQPMKELKAKGVYKHHKEVRAAHGVKIVAPGLQHAMAGTSLIVVKPGDDLRQAETAAMQEMILTIGAADENKDRTAAEEVSRVKSCKEGLYVQASSIGTLEAIIDHLKSSNVDIPVSDWNLGPVNKQDVMKATAMLNRKEEYAAILAFDVKVMHEASVLAAESGVRIFMADTVYKLVDSYAEHINGLKEAKKMQCAAEAVFPCTLKILPNRVYHNKDPIVCDVEILEGVLKVGTPICVSVPSKDRSESIPSKGRRENIVHSLGRISSIKTSNGNQILSARNGVVSIKIMGDNPHEKSRSFGRHFEANDELLSQISRKSIDVLKEYYRDEMTDENWQLIRRLKKQFKIA